MRLLQLYAVRLGFAMALSFVILKRGLRPIGEPTLLLLLSLSLVLLLYFRLNSSLMLLAQLFLVCAQRRICESHPAIFMLQQRLRMLCLSFTMLFLLHCLV